MASNKLSNTAPEAAKRPLVAFVGGGSGGHITPALVVAEELKKLLPQVRLVFIGQTGDKLRNITTKHPDIKAVYAVRAGKLRRYHGEGLGQFLDIKTWAKNIRDLFYVQVGIWQSYKLLKKLRPDCIFIKGGYVGVPVGLAAALLHVPYITHDSDAVPGLANRIISRWARAHAVALPKSVYNYPPEKTHTVGVPISSKFQPVTQKLQAQYKSQLGLKPDSKVLFVTGGGMGAQRLNEAVVSAAATLLPNNPQLHIIHATGPDHEQAIRSLYNHALGGQHERQRVVTKGFFIGDLYINSGAADIVVTRAGATNIAEFAAQHKACIIVPNPMLTSGHQLKNADYLTKQRAAVLIADKELTLNSQLLADAVQQLLDNPRQRQQLGNDLANFARPRAAKDLAELLLETINQRQ